MFKDRNYSFRELERFFEPTTTSKINEEFSTEINLNYEVDYDENGITILLEAPGYTKENIDIELDNNMMTIKGARNYKLNKQDKVKKFRTKLNLGSAKILDDIDAKLENGILKIHIPKQEKKLKVKIS